jgi:hypothetical protein
VIEGKLGGRIEMIRRRRKQLLDDLKEKRRYWKLKEQALIAHCGDVTFMFISDDLF